jgi:dolichol-phosphate mannosyltransferase
LYKSIENTIVLIPSLNPDELLVIYLEQLRDIGFRKIVVVDDGSNMESQKYFDKVKKMNEVTLLKHTQNRGKGAALKTGFIYVLSNFNAEEIQGVVTADADGQHSATDTAKVAEKLSKNNGEMILGSRNFNAKNVPWKSAWGNKITTFIFALFYGKKISDTQTGLRGIPFSYLKACTELKKDRFDYEIEMLIDAVHSKREIVEEPIETIYIDSNRATHFNSVKDSVRIYKVIFSMFIKFSFTGLSSFLIDIILFALLTKLIFSSVDVSYAVPLATGIARVISSIYNFIMNKNIVFKVKNSEQKMWKYLLKYYSLCIVQLSCSALFVLLVYDKIQWDTTLIKGIVDLILFFISYQVQRLWVFREEKQ